MIVIGKSIEEKRIAAKEFYAKNREKIKARHNEYRLKNREKLNAKKKEHYLKNREKMIEQGRQRRKTPEYKEYVKSSKFKESNRRYTASIRPKLVAELGGKCVKCGFNDIRALQIDHINGGGSKEVRKRGTTEMYRFYLKNKEEAIKKLQILCANCNWIKKVIMHEVG